MKKILLATDFSPSAKRAIDYALNCFVDYPVSYHLVYISECKNAQTTTHGITKPCQGESCTLKRQLLGENAKQINKRLDRTQQQCIAYYKNLSKIEALRKHSSEHEIDLIVIGSKGQTNDQQVTLGAFARDIITRVQCSFLIVPEAAQLNPPQKLLFPTNYTNVYHNAPLQTLADFRAMGKMNLDVMYFSRHERELDPTQIENKELLNDFLEGSPNNTWQIIDQSLETAIAGHIINSPADVLVLMAKNRSFCQRLLQRDAQTQRNLISKMPVLLLHE